MQLVVINFWDCDHAVSISSCHSFCEPLHHHEGSVINQRKHCSNLCASLKRGLLRQSSKNRHPAGICSKKLWCWPTFWAATQSTLSLHAV